MVSIIALKFVEIFRIIITNASVGQSCHFYKSMMITVKNTKRYLTRRGNTKELGLPIGQAEILAIM